MAARHCPPGIARPARRLVLGALMLSGAALLIAFTPIFGEKTGIAAGAPEMPRNALAAADHATARDLWARRTPDDLKQSITLFEAVIARQAGKDSAAMAELDGLATKYPGDATVHNCLAWAKIAAGNITGYAAMTRSMAGAMSTPRWCAACARPTR